jgi:tetraacyldisaccharide 4'-kinase
MRVLGFVLFPFAILFDLVTGIRNRLYDIGLKPSTEFDVPVISVGNLAVGGTGKTPMIEYLVRLISPMRKVATLSRGYGRNTSGFRIASSKDSALTVGDEPFQFYKKFHRKIIVAVGEERALAIPNILQTHDNVEVILLDDAFQHRRVKPGFQILLTDYNNLFTEDYLLPTGRLRESKSGANRADVIVVTKCPHEISDEEMIAIDNKVRRIANKPVFFSTIRYGDLIPFKATESFAGKAVILLSGLANADPLERHISQHHKLMKHYRFADHHIYSQEEIRKIADEAQQHHATVITTEKDASKLMSDQFNSITSKVSFFYLPIEIEFLKNGKDFDAMVLNSLTRAV